MLLFVDMRSRLFFDEINDILDKLESNEELNFKILFLDATMVNWFLVIKRHVVATHWRQMAVFLDGIKLERELLSPLRV